MKYLAITASGAEYRIDTESGFWRHRDDPLERIWEFQVGPDEVHLPWTDEGKAQWEIATEPVIGKRMYLSSREVWRISTPVVSVEVYEDE